MPLRPGNSPAIKSENIREFHTGKTYAHTVSKFGKARANAQAVAVALNTARKYADGGKTKSDPIGDLIKGRAKDEIRNAVRSREYDPLIYQAFKGLSPSRKNGDAIDYNTDEIMRNRTYGPNEQQLADGGDAEDTLLVSKKRAGGGRVDNFFMHQAARNLHNEGFIHSPVPGRTDKIPMSVPAGSYVLPADIPSALGQGNSVSGGNILDRMFKRGPYGMQAPKGGGRPTMPHLNFRQPRPPKSMFADGGEPEGENGNVKIIAAGAEYLIHPDVVKDIGHGDMNKGHRVLDAFVKHVRAQNVKTLKSLPGPKK